VTIKPAVLALLNLLRDLLVPKHKKKRKNRAQVMLAHVGEWDWMIGRTFLGGARLYMIMTLRTDVHELQIICMINSHSTSVYWPLDGKRYSYFRCVRCNWPIWLFTRSISELPFQSRRQIAVGAVGRSSESKLIKLFKGPGLALLNCRSVGLNSHACASNQNILGLQICVPI
jgi:hypothetical protein